MSWKEEMAKPRKFGILTKLSAMRMPYIDQRAPEMKLATIMAKGSTSVDLVLMTSKRETNGAAKNPTDKVQPIC